MHFVVQVFAFVALLSIMIIEVVSHGRLMDPPARNSMWRFGYPNPVNYDDHQLWCGGANEMMGKNGGKCGICGDDWSQTQPRDNEAGGMYGNGLIVKRYATGQVLDMEVELTANHMGYFELRLCPVKDSKQEVTEECLNSNQLKVVSSDGNLMEKYVITSEEKSQIFHFKVKLPPFLSCSHCVLQWTYVAANTWGTCANGTEAVGCGPQETFKNCADVAIIPNSGGFGPQGPKFKLPNPNTIYYKDYSKTGNESYVPLVVRDQLCMGTGTYSEVPGIDTWCQNNCLKYPPSCPEDKCRCIKDCDAIGSFKKMPGSGVYCREKCLTSPPINCTKDKCACY